MSIQSAAGICVIFSLLREHRARAIDRGKCFFSGSFQLWVLPHFTMLGVLHDLKECKMPQLPISRTHFTGPKLSNEYYNVNDSKRRPGQGPGAMKCDGVPQNVDLPPILPKKKKKPYPIPLRKILQASRADKKLAQMGIEKSLEPPKKGLLVPDLVPVAYEVLDAWKILIGGVAQLLHIVPGYACSECSEVHVAHSGHEIQD